MYPRAVIESFKKHFGTVPQIVVRAPGRINLIGEHTDYNGGFVLPAAIDKAIWFAASCRDDGRFLLHAADLRDSFFSQNGLARQEEKTWANYLLGVISEARRDGLAVGGVNVVFGGDVPPGAGLSSSAAVESGMIFCLNELWQLGLEPMQRVRLAQRAENNFVGMQCGIMDMFASVMGRENRVVRLDCRSLDFEYFPFENDALELILLDSGVKHQLVDSEYNTRRSECEMGVEILKKFDPNIELLRDVSADFLARHRSALPEVVHRRCHFVVEEIERVEAACAALQRGDFAYFGDLMFACHAGLSREYEVCVPETDFLVEVAKSDPAVLGARQMGGGFGGCTLNLVKKSGAAAFVEAARRTYSSKFGLDLPCHEVALTDGVGAIFWEKNEELAVFLN